MNAVTVVTLTGFADIFAQLSTSVKRFESQWRRIAMLSRGVSLLDAPGWECVVGPEPFNFARNANLGILLADQDDVLLINDDVQFLHAGGILELQRVAYLVDKVGIVSPQFCGVTADTPQTGNKLQNVNQSHLVGPVISHQRLCFTCVYIKRALIDSVGLLDERFDGYGCEDDDYHKRMTDAEWLQVVTPSVVVRHGFEGESHSCSFKRTLGKDQEESAKKMLGLLRAKWTGQRATQ